MLFQTTEAHEALRAKIRAFAEAEVKPNAHAMDQESKFPTEAIQKLGELGLMGIPYPKAPGLSSPSARRRRRKNTCPICAPGKSWGLSA